MRMSNDGFVAVQYWAMANCREDGKFLFIWSDQFPPITKASFQSWRRRRSWGPILRRFERPLPIPIRIKAITHYDPASWAWDESQPDKQSKGVVALRSWSALHRGGAKNAQDLSIQVGSTSSVTSLINVDEEARRIRRRIRRRRRSWHAHASWKKKIGRLRQGRFLVRPPR